ncbi:MAG: murein biosynthesis integral membrane protein MurJ [Alphaproteobacteria bacterium]|nr:murein biosynthesis integral membrane protein MurJ [Alphaproteobacteria bacterium]MDE2629742.1 murein biosynthesis integral membrane protein MurJ [Alphaproteobacteria bacterium]
MFKRLLTVAGFTAVSRVTGFLRDIVMNFVLGAGPMSDAFMVAFRLPNNFRAIFGEGAFNAAFLPRFAKLRTQEGPEAADRFADAIYSWQIVAQLVLLVAALVGMRYVIAALAPGFNAYPEKFELATALSRITFWYLIMTVSSVQLSAMLNAVEKFAAAAAWSILLNVAMTATLLLAHWFPNAAYAAAWGVFLGGVTQLGFIAVAAARSHLRLHIRIPRWTPQVREFLWALGAATIGSASIQISVFIDTVLSSYLPDGPTALYYADRINQLPTGTLAIAMGTVLLPEMSNLLAKNDLAGANAAQNRAAALVLFLTLPFAAAFFAVPMTIMRGLFPHVASDLVAGHMAAAAIAGYGAGLPAFVLVRIVSASFYARHDTASPARATIVSVVLNIALKVVLVWGLHFGVLGIALGTSFGAWANVGMLAWMAKRRSLLSVNRNFWRSLAPTIIAAAAVGAGALAGEALGENLVLHPGLLRDEVILGLAVLAGGLSYGIAALAFRKFLPLERLRR